MVPAAGRGLVSDAGAVLLWEATRVQRPDPWVRGAARDGDEAAWADEAVESLLAEDARIGFWTGAGLSSSSRK